MTDSIRRRTSLTVLAVFAAGSLLGVGLLGHRTFGDRRPASAAAPALAPTAADGDCPKVEKGCPIGGLAAPPAEVPGATATIAAPPRPTGPTPGTTPSAAEIQNTRARLDQVLKNPGFQQVLANQVRSQIQAIDAAVHLDPAQRAKLEELLDRQVKAGVNMGAAVFGGGDGAAGQDDVFTIQREIEAIFTPEQRIHYDEYRKTKAEQARARQREAEETGLIGSLGLEASQRAEVEAMVSASELGHSGPLGDEEREALLRGGSRSASRAAAIQRMLEKDVEDPELTAKLRATLKPEQFSRYEQYLAKKRHERETLRAMLQTQ